MADLTKTPAQRAEEREAREARERWLYFAEEHLDGPALTGEPCHGGGRNVAFAWEARTGDPLLLEVGPCSRCGQVVEVRRRS